jgi:hypothetical protein
MPHGGKRAGSGRKRKAEEIELIEKLSPLDGIALQALESGVKRGDFQFTKMFFEYRFGKPQDKVDITSGGETITAIKLVDVDGSEL